MQRSLFPLILASLGFCIFRFVINMPFLEWQVSEIVADFPPNYRVDISPSPWISNLGDSISDGAYILQEIRIIGDGSFCRKENLNFIVKRSYKDQIVERMLNANQGNSGWLLAWGIIELVLSGIYIWWSIIEHTPKAAINRVIVMGIAGFIYVILILISRVLGPQLGYVGIANCHGLVTFNAKLTKVHYETLIVLFVGVLLELGALGVILNKLIKTVMERKRYPN